MCLLLKGNYIITIHLQLFSKLGCQLDSSNVGCKSENVDCHFMGKTKHPEQQSNQNPNLYHGRMTA